MADNVAITPGSGATAASDDIGGVQFQRIKLVHGADGVNDGDVSSANGLPVQGVGELMEAIEALRLAVQSLTRSIGLATVDVTGRTRMLAENPTAANLQATVSLNAGQTLGTVTTLTTMTNQSQMGGLATNDQIPALMHLQADNLRRNISVT
jgi:hypothetical protein